MEQEGQQLRAAGHDVESFTIEAAGDDGTSAARALDAVWNRTAGADLARRITAFRPGVVHVHTPFPLMSPAVFRVASRLGCPTVTTAHSYRYSCIAGTCLRAGSPCELCVGKVLKLPGLRYRCYHDSLGASAALTLSLATHHATGTFSRHVGRFIALTDFAARLLVRDGIPARKVVVKPNSVPDPGAVSPLASPLTYAVFAGRLVEEKGIRTLLAAWREAGGGMPLRIAGDGPLRDLVAGEAASNPAVTYLGWLSTDQMTALLAGSSLVVVPSEWYEAQPLVLLQAFAAGRPVLCSDLENISASVLQAGAGEAFATGQASSLADAVLRLSKDPAQLRAMGLRARELYEARHTPQASLRSLESIYRACGGDSGSVGSRPGQPSGRTEGRAL